MMAEALTTLGAALVASLFILSLSRIIFCRLLFKVAGGVTAMAEAITRLDRRG